MKHALFLSLSFLLLISCNQVDKSKQSSNSSLVSEKGNADTIKICTAIYPYGFKNPETIQTNAALWLPYKLENKNIYVLLDGGSPLVRSKVIQYAKNWEEVCGVRFHFGQEKYPDIIVSFNIGSGSWSYIGKDSRGKNPSMNFGWFYDNTSDAEFERTVVHEFGHALGYIHEHQNPNGNPILWDVPKVNAYYLASQGWDAAKTYENVIKRYQINQLNATTFDPLSIMLYSFPASLTINGVGTPFNTKMSPTDKIIVSSAYPLTPNNNWYLNNFNGHENPPIVFPQNCKITKIQVKEQFGFGIIDIRFEFRTSQGIGWTNWVTNNHNQNLILTSSVPDNQSLIGFDVFEQSGFGVIDIAPVFINLQTQAITRGNQITTNPNAHRISYHSINDGHSQIQTFKVREQSGFGIINISRS